MITGRTFYQVLHHKAATETSFPSGKNKSSPPQALELGSRIFYALAFFKNLTS